MEEFEYGDWATWGRTRWMISDWTEDRSRVKIGRTRGGGEYVSKWVGREELSRITHFMNPDKPSL